jgi:hypothetical protein
MPSASQPDGLTLAQLEELMQTRRAELGRLLRQREKLQKRLEAIESRINAVAGAAARGANGKASRARNHVSLQDAIHRVLSKAGGALSVGDIVDKVLASGYRSHSVNFRGIVNQTLIKDKRFGSAGRGMYQLKK